MIGHLIRFGLCLSCFGCAFHAAQIAIKRMRGIRLSGSNITLEDILRDRALCFLLFAALALVLSYAFSFLLLIPGLVCSWLLSIRAPKMLDARRAEELRRSCDEHIDTMTDIVALGIQAGLSFDAALSLYCSKFDNALATHLERAQIEWKSGLASREEALLSMASSIDSKALKRFSETSIQAVAHGSPLANMLRRFSDDIRQCKRNGIERQIAKAPVKMLIPMGTCILPAMIILVIGPVLLQFVQTNL